MSLIAIANLNTDPASGEKQILGALQMLSDQITQLSIDMHSRFDRIEQVLAVGFESIADDFRELVRSRAKHSQR